MWKVEVVRETRKGICKISEKKFSNDFLGRQHVVAETGDEPEEGLGWWRTSRISKDASGRLQWTHWYVVPANWTL